MGNWFSARVQPGAAVVRVQPGAAVVQPGAVAPGAAVVQQGAVVGMEQGAVEVKILSDGFIVGAVFMLAMLVWCVVNSAPSSIIITALITAACGLTALKILAPQSPQPAPPPPPEPAPEPRPNPPAKRRRVFLENDEGAQMEYGLSFGHTHKLYCGRTLGAHRIPGSDGQCGTHNGPQCASCRRFQVSHASVNDNHAPMRFGTRTGSTDTLYCGQPGAIPGSDGYCGPDNGPQCASCQFFQASKNDEKAVVRYGTDRQCRHRFYCGRFLGAHRIPGSDGRCGPRNGPQCPSCQKFQAVQM